MIGTTKEVINWLLEQDKDKLFEIKEHKAKRSLNANAYFWVLCQKIAEVIKSSKEEVYLEMLKRYGVFTHLIVKPEAVPKIKSQWRTAIELGEVKVNGKKGVQLQLYYGSSTYDSKEFSVLLNGVVDECKTLNIETLEDLELERLIKEWGE